MPTEFTPVSALLGGMLIGLAATLLYAGIGRIAELARDADLLPKVHALADRLLQDAPDAANRIIDRWVGGAARFAAA